MLRRRIAILSDQTLFREGIEDLLRRRGFTNVSAFGSSAGLLEAARTHPPHLVFVDLDHEREDVMALVQRLRRALLDTQIVVIGSAMRQGVADGAVDGELETPAADAVLLAAAALGTLPRRRSPEAARQQRLWSTVTPRQRDVLRCMATGSDNRAIAARLRIGERAVKAHVSALLDHFNLHNRAQLALLADHAGLRMATR
jgi:two-component system nitrate/nitrite response regulator NarL